MILTANFENYRQGDTIQFIKNLTAIIPLARATALKITAPYNAMAATLATLLDKWQPTLGSELTPEITTLDNQRDLTFMGIKLTADNWAINHFDPARRNAAFLISERIAAHGDRISIMRYQQETATLNAIIHDLTTDLADEVALLAINEWVDHLKTLNDTFDAKYVQRAQALSGFVPGEIADLITKVIAEYRELLRRFTSRYDIAIADADPNVDAYGAAEQEWNSIINQYNDAVNRYAGDDAPPANPPAPADAPENPEEPNE